MASTIDDSVTSKGTIHSIPVSETVEGTCSELAEKEQKNFTLMKKIRINKLKNTEVEEMTREQLVDKVKQLEKHVTQLRNIISKNEGNKKIKGRKDRSQRPLDFTRYNTRHVAIKLLYLGWDYRGYAVQEDSEKTIEHQLFDALIKTKLVEKREASNYHRCGRTDKGVSAFSQVVSLDLRTNLLEGIGVKVRENGTAHERPGDKTTEINYVHILNKMLPPEIRAICWCPVTTEFSARFSCRQRTYKYFFPKGNLDLDQMNKAAEKLLGEHDFRNLCKMDVQNGVINYMRKISHANVTVLDNESEGYQICELTVIGQAFLWHQIRCIVAVLYLVAEGKEQPSVIEELLNVEKYPCKPQYTLASEVPLVLFGSEYDQDDVNWIYDEECHIDNVKHMQELWTYQAVKQTIIKRMLDEFVVVKINKEVDRQIVSTNLNEGPILNQAQFLLGGSKPKVYKPLMERDKCESLEGRIQHFTKRRKLIIE